MSRQTGTLSVISDGNLSSASPQHRGNLGELVFLQSPVQVCLDDMPRLHQEEPLLCPRLCFPVWARLPGRPSPRGLWQFPVHLQLPNSQLRAGEKEGWRPQGI